MDEQNKWFKDKRSRGVERNSSLNVAAKPPDFIEKPEDDSEYWQEPAPGLPRPQWRTDESNQYEKDRYQDGDRRRYLFQKIPVPWNTETIGAGDVPQFDKDSLNPSDGSFISKPEKLRMLKEKPLSELSQSVCEKRCPMCGGQFSDNEQAIRYTGSDNINMLSDYLPYHPHCMDLVKIHCPHIREGAGDDDYVLGTYKKLMQGAQDQVAYVVDKNIEQDHYNKHKYDRFIND
jgi:hypothetical protein